MHCTSLHCYSGSGTWGGGDVQATALPLQVYVHILHWKCSKAVQLLLVPPLPRFRCDVWKAIPSLKWSIYDKQCFAINQVCPDCASTWTWSSSHACKQQCSVLQPQVCKNTQKACRVPSELLYMAGRHHLGRPGWIMNCPCRSSDAREFQLL